MMKLAWKWLDRLLGRTDMVKSKDLELVYLGVRDNLILILERWIPQIQRHEKKVAIKNGIDPNYLNWAITRGQFPSLTSSQRRALQAIKSLYLWYGYVPDSWNGMEVPEENRLVDRAMLELVGWFQATVIKDVDRHFTKSVVAQAQILAAGWGEDVAQVSLGLMEDFEQRLVQDRFQLKPALQKVVDLLE